MINKFTSEVDAVEASKELRLLREKVLYTLADGGFADKRTDLEAWTQALSQAQALMALVEAQALALALVRDAARVEIAPADMTDAQALKSCQEAIRRIRRTLTITLEHKGS